MDASEIADDDIVYYLAASLDGFIATRDGGVDWLNEYFGPELGFHSFMARIRGAIMGRGTWDKMIGLTGGKSAYGAMPVTVVTNRPFEAAGPVGVAAGSPQVIVAAMRARSPGPYWLVGGAHLATQLLEGGLLTRIDLFTIPVLLGEGIPAFVNRTPVALDLVSTGTYPKGITRASFRPRR